MRSLTVRSGVDTVAIGWSGQGGSELASAMVTADAVQVSRGFAPGWLLAERDKSGARVLWYPKSSFVKVEARLSALLAVSDEVHDLTAPERLREAPDAARAVLRRLIAAAPEGVRAEIRRLDLASERRFDDGADGLAFLRAAALLTPGSAYKSKLIRAGDGRIETGYVLTNKGRVVARVYDKGVEAGTDPPGRRVRVEGQNRFSKADAPTPEQLSSADLRPYASRPWAVYAKHGEQTIVANIEGATDELVGRVGAGSLSVRKAERMIGTLTLLQRYGRAIYHDRQARRRLQDLREEGVVVDDLLPRERIVPVGSLLRELLQPFDPGGRAMAGRVPTAQDRTPEA